MFATPMTVIVVLAVVFFFVAGIIMIRRSMRNELRAGIACRRCGAKNPPPAKFCAQCGASLSKSEP